MSLSVKISLGFIIANVVSLILLAAVFLMLRPVQHKSEGLNQYVLPIFERAADIKFQVAEQRSTMRAYVSSPNLDPKIFDQLMTYNTIFYL
jgi:CHASE3 domain sensor protein